MLQKNIHEKNFLSILVIVLLASCKKNNTNTFTCEQTMAEIAGKYKLMKLELISNKTGAIQDVTSTLTNSDIQN